MTYPGPRGYPQYPPARPTNTLAIASLVVAFVFAPLGIVFGHIALSQIKRSGQEGRGFALAGTIVGYVLTSLAVVTVAGVAIVVVMSRPPGDEAINADSNSTSTSTVSSPRRTTTTVPATGGLPVFRPPQGLGDNCTYPTSPQPAAKQVDPPRSGKVPTEPAIVSVSMTTNQGPIGLKLDNAKAPCTVNNFVSLAQKGFFNDTHCHRLTAGSSLLVLQCGDPKGDGTGGPGYQFANEYPTNQYPSDDPALHQPLTYPRGTLAMANAGPGTNGSQFFIVYEDSVLPPLYTVFGTIDEKDMAVLDKIAQAGTSDGSSDGKPRTDVVITSVRLD